jgi:hypothetical protein
MGLSFSGMRVLEGVLLLLFFAAVQGYNDRFAKPDESDILVIGHRGAPAYRLEETTAAYEIAHFQRASFLETDLCVTSDGHLVRIYGRSFVDSSNGRSVGTTASSMRPQTSDSTRSSQTEVAISLQTLFPQLETLHHSSSPVILPWQRSKHSNARRNIPPTSARTSSTISIRLASPLGSLVQQKYLPRSDHHIGRVPAVCESFERGPEHRTRM